MGSTTQQNRRDCRIPVEAATGDRIALHVADAGLRLALRPCDTLARDAPVATERAERGVNVHDARSGIAPENQRAGIVDEHCLRDAAEVHKGSGESLSPIVVSLAQNART